jgi:hypothetical protein
MRRIVSATIAVAVLVAAGGVYATGISQSAVLFLRISAGARASGMGEAFVAIADDATATHWNPAGLGNYPLSSVHLSSPWPESVYPSEKGIKEITTQLFAALPVEYEERKAFIESANDLIEARKELRINSEAYSIFLDLAETSLADSALSIGEADDIMPALDKATSAEITSMAVSGNGRPERNFHSYDVWVVSDGELWMYDGEAWNRGAREKTTGMRGLPDFLRELTGVNDEERISVMCRAIAEANNRRPRSEVEALIDRVVAAIPEGYTSPETFVASADDLLEAWDELRVDPDGYRTLEDLVNTTLADGELSTLEADKISFALDRAASGGLPEEITIPYSLLFPAVVTCLETDPEGDLLVGTESGLWRRSGDRWIELTSEDAGFPSTFIRDVAVNGSGTIAVGTDAGLSVYVRGEWSHPVLNDDSTRTTAVTTIAVNAENDVWAATPEGLTHFDGEIWTDAFKTMVKPGDTEERIVDRFTAVGADRAQVAETFVAYNLGVEVRQGTNVWVPLSGATSAPIVDMVVDGDGDLWVGTEAGVVRLGDDGAVRYGYETLTVTPGQTVGDIVARYAPGGGARAEWFASRLRADNNLSEGEEPAAGASLLVYMGPAGSSVNALASSNGNVYVATERGLLVTDGEEWKRYDGVGLGDDNVAAVVLRDGERWFASPDGLVVYAHAKTELTFMHVKWLPELADDLFYDFFSAVHNFEGWGTFGVNVTFLNLGTNTRTDESGNVLGTFQSYEGALSLSYGTRFTPDLAVGISGKFIYSHLADAGQGAEEGKGEGTSFAVDLGMLYRVPFMRRLSIGAALTNIGPNIAYIDADQADPLPRNLAVGLAYRLLDGVYNRMTLIYEANKELVGLSDDMTTELTEVVSSIGAEYWYGTFIALRAGYFYDRIGERRNPTFGGSLAYGDYRFDFSYIPSGEETVLDNITRFSLTARF